MPPAKRQKTAMSAFDAISISSSSSSSESSASIQPTAGPSRRSARVVSNAAAQAANKAAAEARAAAIAAAGPPPPKPKRVTKPKASTSMGQSSSSSTPQYVTAGVFEDDDDVIQDDAFAMALKYQSPEPERVFDKGLYGTEGYEGLEEFEPRILNSPPPGTEGGLGNWNADVKRCEKLAEGKKGWKVEGYVGMEGVVSGLKRAGIATSITFEVAFDDMDGSSFAHSIKIDFSNLSTYPITCSTLITITSTQSIRKAHQRALDRFKKIHDLPVKELITRLVSALQGDDDANGGTAQLEEDDEMMMATQPEEENEYHGGGIGRGFEVAKGSMKDLGKDWGRVKVDFLQGKQMGYRPGMTQVSDYWVVSYSIPLKSMSIDPNELAIWDDDLAEAWHDDKRLTLLMRMDKYGVPYAQTQWALTLDRNYKPSKETIARHTLGKQNGKTSSDPIKTFFLSDALTSHLKIYPRSYQLRISYDLNWDTADRYGMDDSVIQRIFDMEITPSNVGPDPTAEDPVAMGFKDNLPLCAFYWLCRRFTHATRYCLSCGVEVGVQGRRPYVCDKGLCLYGMMCLGLGPSLSHTIQTHSGVVDLLLSFAHAAASSTTRMDLPSGLNVEVPPESGICETLTSLDDLPAPDQRRALVWLIESLPRVSALSAHVESNKPLSSAIIHSGALTVLRWVVGSCRAYLRETKSGEGVVNDLSKPVVAGQGGFSGYGSQGISENNIRQFSFVVGNPEQEEAFKGEIEIAKKTKPALQNHPTLLAFHGSGMERWHNILRVGLDFQEVANARAYGHGVYFASDSNVSMGAYARPSTTKRPDADFILTRATALVELVNVPETFVSRNPYYVVNNIKQIKPFLLLVEGTVTPVEEKEVKEEVDMEIGADLKVARGVNGTPVKVARGKGIKRLFVHDQALQLRPTYFQRPLEVQMPEKISKEKYIDTQKDDAYDSKIYAPPPKPTPIIDLSSSPPPAPKPIVAAAPKKKTHRYTPAGDDIYKQITLLPPPSETSPQATRAIMRELKATMAAQGGGELPFWVKEDSDRLYSWTLELFEFDEDSLLWADMKKLGITAIIAEIRFGASFPFSPPFMRILYPRCLQFAAGGGGNITAGGSVCNEIMTTTGWNPAFTVEAIIRDIMLNMTTGPRPARLDMRNWKIPYGIHEAVEAYKRVARDHGWEVPKDFDKIAMGL